MKHLTFKLLTVILCFSLSIGALAQGSPTPPAGTTQPSTGSGGNGLSGTGAIIDDLSNTLGVDLFEDDIDNVVFSTNEFLTNTEFTGNQGPFWWILQMSMALAALFSIILAASMGYKMMVKGEPFDVFKILRVLGVACVLVFWYPTSSGKGSILDILAFIPNCIGSYTHDLYQAEAVQVNEEYQKIMPLLQKRDEAYLNTKSTIENTDETVSQAKSPTVSDGEVSPEDATATGVAVKKLKALSDLAGAIVGLDKIIMFLSLIIYRVGWWSTIFCQQILLGMLTIFGPIQWAFSILPKWEGAWAKWIIRYLTVHFYGAMLYFVGFYVLLLFDIVLSVQIEKLEAITQAGAAALTASSYASHAFISCGYLFAASLVALKCLNLVPDLAAWMIPEGDTAYSTRNFGEGVASSVKGQIASVMPGIK